MASAPVVPEPEALALRERSESDSAPALESLGGAASRDGDEGEGAEDASPAEMASQPGGEGEEEDDDDEDDDDDDDDEEGKEAYHPGGFHPVYIGDVFAGKYKVLNKIGYGIYSTVWLVEDTTRP